MLSDVLATIGEWLIIALSLAVSFAYIGLLALIAIGFVVMGILEAWRSSERRPLHMFGILLRAVIPSWWTLAKITPIAFALWSLNIVMQSDLGSGVAIVGMTLLGCGLMASMAVTLFHEKVQQSEERTKQTLEKWEQRERESKKE